MNGCGVPVVCGHGVSINCGNPYYNRIVLCEDCKSGETPDYITSIHYDKGFEAFWGDKAEKWNGKLDIKQFSYEIWKAAKE